MNLPFCINTHPSPIHEALQYTTYLAKLEGKANTRAIVKSFSFESFLHK